MKFVSSRVRLWVRVSARFRVRARAVKILQVRVNANVINNIKGGGGLRDK